MTDNILVTCGKVELTALNHEKLKSTCFVDIFYFLFSNFQTGTPELPVETLCDANTLTESPNTHTGAEEPCISEIPSTESQLELGSTPYQTSVPSNSTQQDYSESILGITESPCYINSPYTSENSRLDAESSNLGTVCEEGIDLIYYSDQYYESLESFVSTDHVQQTTEGFTRSIDHEHLSTDSKDPSTMQASYGGVPDSQFNAYDEVRMSDEDLFCIDRNMVTVRMHEIQPEKTKAEKLALNLNNIDSVFGSVEMMNDEVFMIEIDNAMSDEMNINSHTLLHEEIPTENEEINPSNETTSIVVPDTKLINDKVVVERIDEDILPVLNISDDILSLEIANEHQYEQKLDRKETKTPTQRTPDKLNKQTPKKQELIKDLNKIYDLTTDLKSETIKNKTKIVEENKQLKAPIQTTPEILSKHTSKKQDLCKNLNEIYDLTNEIKEESGKNKTKILEDNKHIKAPIQTTTDKLNKQISKKPELSKIHNEVYNLTDADNSKIKTKRVEDSVKPKEVVYRSPTKGELLFDKWKASSKELENNKETSTQKYKSKLTGDELFDKLKASVVTEKVKEPIPQKTKFDEKTSIKPSHIDYKYQAHRLQKPEYSRRPSTDNKRRSIDAEQKISRVEEKRDGVSPTKFYKSSTPVQRDSIRPQNGTTSRNVPRTAEFCRKRTASEELTRFDLKQPRRDLRSFNTRCSTSINPSCKSDKYRKDYKLLPVDFDKRKSSSSLRSPHSSPTSSSRKINLSSNKPSSSTKQVQRETRSNSRSSENKTDWLQNSDLLSVLERYQTKNNLF